MAVTPTILSVSTVRTGLLTQYVVADEMEVAPGWLSVLMLSFGLKIVEGEFAERFGVKRVYVTSNERQLKLALKWIRKISDQTKGDAEFPEA